MGAFKLDYAEELAAKELAAKESAAKELAAKELAAKELTTKELTADCEIIQFLEKEVLCEFNIDGETLRNWQTELSDVAGDAISLEIATAQEIVLQFPPGPIYFNEKQKNALEICLTKLDALDSEVYIDFKMIIYEVLTRATTGLYTCRIQLLRSGFIDYLCSDFIAYTCGMKDDLSEHQQSIYGAKAKLLSSFLELGCDVKQYKKLVLPLFCKSSKTSFTGKRLLLDLLGMFLERCPSTYSTIIFNNFLLRPVTIPINSELCLQKCFTISMWFKHNDMSIPSLRDEELLPITLLSLANCAVHDHLYFKIQFWNGKFVICIHNVVSRSKRQFTFNHVAKRYSNENQGFTHFVLTYDIYQNLNLYLDGDYCESIPCPSISKADIRWNKLYIGDPIEVSDRDHLSLNLFDKREFILKDLALMDMNLPFEWVSLLFYLGLGFDWSHRDFSESNILAFLDSLKKQEYVLMMHRAKEILNSKRQGISHWRQTRSSNMSSSRNCVSITKSHHSLPTKYEVASLLASAQLCTSNYLFDINDSQFIEFLDHSRNQEIIFHGANSFCASLYSWGGSGLLLSLIETVMKDYYTDDTQRHVLVFDCLKLLLSCLQKDWRTNKEFENIDGYWALALLLDHYKSHYNPNLSFMGTRESPKIGSRDDQSLVLVGESFLALLLEYTTAKQNAGIFICDSLAFKTLVLNFDLFSTTPNFSVLRSCIMDLLATERYEFHNFKELTKMRILKKLLQHIKTSFFDKQAPTDDLTTLLSVVINFELSVDSIKSVSQFIIFALYNNDTEEVSQRAGLNVLLALTNKLCGLSSSIKMLKKFSRSISIHWILLLLAFDGENKSLSARVVCCAVALLAKFLRALGPSVIRRFFRTNRGLEVMSYFLQKWWNNDSVISTIFLNSFDIDSGAYDGDLPTLPDLLANPRIINSKSSAAIPDYINLLNELALAGAIQLGRSEGKVLSSPTSPKKVRSINSDLAKHNAEIIFNLMHLLNQMADMIERGLSESAPLRENFTGRSWLESAFEIVAHLKVLQEANTGHITSQEYMDFKTCATRFISVLSAIFVSMILDSKCLLTIIGSVSDMTKKLILDTIFPHIFEHIIGFLSNSNFIFREPEFIRGATDILVLYHNDFMLQNYHLSQDDLSTFITCLVVLLEANNLQSATANQLGPILGHTLVFRLSCISHIASDVDEEVMENEFAEDLDSNVTFCLQKQALILSPIVLDSSHLRSTIELIMGYFLKLSPSKQLELAEHVLNFLRSIIVIRGKEVEKLVPQLAQLSDYKESVRVLSDFLSFVATHNDEETVKFIQKVPIVKRIFNKCFHFRLSKMRDIGQISVQDMVQVLLNSSGRLGNTINPQLQGFEKDCQTLKSAIITGELMKFNRELQDMLESIRYYSGSYNHLKLDIHRLLIDSPITNSNLTLDYIEGANRMKKLLIEENRLSESEKLSYSVNVPLRPVATMDVQKAAQLHLDSAFSAFGIQEHSADESSSVDAEFEDYEEIDEDGDSNNSYRALNEDRNRKVLRSLYLGDQIQELYNVTKVNGLDAVESLMILGFSHMYFIENYFHSSDGNVVDIDDVPQESRDPYLRFIKPQSEDSKNSRTHRVKTWSLVSLACICKRKFLLRDIALELFFNDGASLLLTCFSTAHRDKVHTKLQPYSSNESLDKDLQITLEISSSSSEQSQTVSASGHNLRSKLMSAFSTSFTSSPRFSEITKKWRMGMMSNFYYLLSINTMAGRTFNDLTQYPIFPWVIADYESEELDLSDPKSFRDLSKPMGAQTSKRAREYKERYEALASMQDANAPAFHYGTHYSSAMIVSSYLIRLKPYVQSYLLLQGGKFDHADRLFNSVGKAWRSASRDNTTDVRELTPEFFYLPEFLVNKNNFEFGELQNGTRANDVALPKWAKGDPKIFIAKNREALESAHVSANLHHWIDLVFGYKQSGAEAIKALNVFHHSSYDGAINLDKIQDEVEKRAVIGMINNFGQTPLRLFSKPHVAKDVLNPPYLQLSLSELNRKPPICTFESKLHLPIQKLEVSLKSRKWIGRPSCVSSEDQVLIRKPSTGVAKCDSGSLIINTTLFMNLHSSNITSLVQIGGKLFLTGSEDGIIQVWKCSLQPTVTLSYHSVLRGHLSAIIALCYNKSYKFCLSMDADGGILQWDTTRFKFVRRIAYSTPQDSSMQLIATSNESGNFCTIHSTKFNNVLTVYTLNGEKITQLCLPPGRISAVSFAQINDSLIESMKTEYSHSFSAEEIIALSFSSPQVNLVLYKLQTNKDGWVLSSFEKVDLRSLISGYVTSMQVYKQVEVCENDRLSRARLMFILGDSKGKVYVW